MIISTETIRRCTPIVISNPTNKVEMPTPAIPPVLHNPWKDPFIFLSNFFCNAMACVFIAILMILMLNEKRHMEGISKAVVLAKPIMESANARKINAAVTGTLLSYRDTSQPEIGSPTKELIGMKRRIVPNSASLYPKVVLIVGILEAHVAKQTPAIKKNTLKKNLCLFFSSMTLNRRRISVVKGN